MRTPARLACRPRYDTDGGQSGDRWGVERKLLTKEAAA
jgi:hypothetical protein